MSFSYDVGRLDVTLNRLRFEIGDTDSDRPLLANEEIELIVSEYSTLSQRAAKCCRMICTKLSGEPTSFKIEGYSESYKDMYSRYESLAQGFEQRGTGGGPWAGSYDVDFKDATEEDTDIVAPFFKRGMHDNTG